MPSTRVTNHAALLAATLILAAPIRAQETEPYPDPAPPKVRVLEDAPAPEARPFEGLTLHRAPRSLAPDATTSDWPCLFGPRRDSRSPETGLALDWGADGPPLVWEMESGQGLAAPVIAERRLVYTHRVGAEEHVDCLDPETGKRFWRFTDACDYRPRYITDGGPRSTPVIHGGRVYVHGVEGELRCLDLATGRVIWERDLAEELGVPDGFFGVVPSPLVHEGLLIQNVGAPGGPCVAAFDLATGRIVWGAGKEWGASCASPVVAEVHGRARVFVLSGGESRPPTGGLLVLDPATGAIDFTYPFRSRTVESVNGASPLVAGDRVFLTASYNTGSAGLALDAEGGFEELFTTRRIGIQFVNPVHIGGHVYVIDGVGGRAGAMVCLDPGTGEELSRTDLDWEEEVTLRGEERTLSMSVGEGSLLHVQGRFLCLGDNGHLLSLEASPEGARVRSRAWLFGASQTWTPPVVSHGLLYVCQNTRESLGGASPPRLLCYDLRASE